MRSFRLVFRNIMEIQGNCVSHCKTKTGKGIVSPGNGEKNGTTLETALQKNSADEQEKEGE